MCLTSRKNARHSRKIIITKIQVIMKEFLEIIGKDIMTENFTNREYVVYGIVAPLVLVLVCGLAGSLA